MARTMYSIFAKESNSGQKQKLEKSDKGVNQAKIYEKEKRSRRFVAFFLTAGYYIVIIDALDILICIATNRLL